MLEIIARELNPNKINRLHGINWAKEDESLYRYFRTISLVGTRAFSA